MKKVLATGLGAAALLVLATPQAQAATFLINAQFAASGSSVKGTFDYNPVGNVYSNWNIVSISPSINSNATTPFTNPFTYTNSNSVTGVIPQTGAVRANTSNLFAFRRSQGTATGNQTRAIQFLTAAGLNTLTTYGATTTLSSVGGLTNSSSEFYVKTGFSTNQRLGFTGTIQAVPEPLTMLGAATAVGFGAAFKRRSLKNSKKG